MPLWMRGSSETVSSSDDLSHPFRLSRKLREGLDLLRRKVFRKRKLQQAESSRHGEDAVTASDELTERSFSGAAGGVVAKPEYFNSA
jgi:hypothetical protein